MKKLLNTKKFISGLQVFPEAEEDVIGIYVRANTLEDMIAQRKVVAWNTPDARVLALIYKEKLPDKLLATAKQFLGVVSRIQRETGFKIINRYISTDEEKLELLREMCSLFNDSEILSEAIG